MLVDVEFAAQPIAPAQGGFGELLSIWKCDRSSRMKKCGFPLQLKQLVLQARRNRADPGRRTYVLPVIDESYQASTEEAETDCTDNERSNVEGVM